MPAVTNGTELLLALTPTAGAVTAARHAMRARGLDPDLEHTVSLLVSEVVGNAVRHARATTKIVLHARLEPGRVHVEIADEGPGFDPEIRHEADGFGLRLLDKLSTDWGVDITRAGCKVWFDLDRTSRFGGANGRAG